jgi:predicted secreted protein
VTTILVVHWAVLVSAFTIFWFLSLFCLFPIGLGEVDAETGAPRNPRILMKMAWATGIAVVLWIGFYALIATGVVDL